MTFRALLPEHFQTLRKYFVYQNSDLCVYSLPSLIVWNNHISSPNFLEKDEHLFISNVFRNEPEKSHMIFPLSLKNEDLEPHYLYESVKELGYKSYWFIPENYIELNQKKLFEYFNIQEQPEYDDYIYISENLALLSGKKLSKKRNLINQFKSNYLDQNKVIVEPIEKNNFKECLQFLNRWFDEKDFDKNDDDFKTEKLAAELALTNYDKLGFDTLIVKVDDIVEGYSMGTRLNNNMWVLHFEKANTNIKGLYQYLDRETAKNIFNEYKYINKESDMGVQGIAHSKKSYYPFKRGKSYILSLK